MTLTEILAAIDAANHADPEKITIDNQTFGVNELYGLRMSEQLQQLYPEASDALKIACRAQHIERWKIARNQYPEGRTGYNQWRRALALHHASRTSAILQSLGCPAELIEQTAALLRKEKLKTNPDTQRLEDVACLVFLHYYFEDFCTKHSQEKLVGIVQKTWKKMSETAHRAALVLSLPQAQQDIIKKALEL